MVDAEEAQTSSLLARPLRGPPPPRSAPPAPELLEPVVGTTGPWELPLIPSGSLDFGDSSGGMSDLSASMWSEDSTAYPSPPPTAASPPSSALPPGAAPPTGIPPHSVAAAQQPRASVVGAPVRMTVDELRTAWERVGVYVAEAASGLLERSKRTLVGNGSYEGFVAEALAQVPNASPPHAPGEYGFLVYAQTGAQVHTRLADIMPGDVVVVRSAKLKGHKGLQSYSMSSGEGTPCVGVVSEFDAKKLKLRALQANQRVGQAVRAQFLSSCCLKCPPPRALCLTHSYDFFFFFGRPWSW
jgi:myosin tail region-interacting protein MTI1